jgi:hypothetical protein
MLKPSEDKPEPKLVPHPILFKVLCVAFVIWMAVLLLMYFLTVYPLRHPSRAKETEPGRAAPDAAVPNPLN